MSPKVNNAEIHLMEQYDDLLNAANTAILQRRREESRDCRRGCGEVEECHGTTLQVRDS